MINSFRFVALLILAVLQMTSQRAIAQLTVAGGANATTLAQMLAGPGITISNATISGAAGAYGTFNGSASNIGLPSGVLLTSGGLNFAVGPNNTGGAGINNGTAGNGQLNGLAGAATYDAVVLEFDFIPLSNLIEFDYVFASEEYPEWVNGGFNDAFAFYISGPGIVGSQNIALVPSTATPVTINTINAWSNGQYYVNNAGGATVQYDAFTTVLTAMANVQACQTYHLRLMIADGGDQFYDSGVFLEEGSLTSNVIEITTTTATADSTAYENCSVATVTFSLSNPVPVDFDVTYNVTGTATNGVDYPMLPGIITIPANTLSSSFVIDPPLDGIVEGIETVIIDIQTSVCETDTILIYINDLAPVTVEAFGDTAFCGGTTLLYAEAQGGGGGYTYTWDNGMNGDSIYISPATTTTYTVTANDFCNSTIPNPTDQVTVTIDPTPLANAGPDIPYCTGDQVTLNGAGGTTFSWYDASNGNLLGAGTPLTISPIGTMNIQMVTWIGGCSDTDYVSIIEQFAPTITVVGDTSICDGQSVQLDVLGAAGSSVTWSPIGGLSNPNIQNPVATPATSAVYTATVVSNSGCIKIDSVEVLIVPIPQANFSVADVCLEQPSLFTDLSSISAGSIQSYDWTFGDGNTDNVSDPTHIYGTENAYNVQLTVVSDQGCSHSIIHTATVNPLPIIDISVVDDCALEDLQFNNNSSISSGNINVSDWLFGDDAQSNAFSPAHAYGNAGAFTVQLHLESDQQCSSDTSFQVQVFPNPVASFSFTNVCDGTAMPFTDLTLVSAPGQLLLSDWYMGDGSGFQDSTLSNYTYATSGDQFVTLAVETTNGCTDTLTQMVTIYPTPVADAGPDIPYCTGDQVTLNGAGGTTFSWYDASNANLLGIGTPLTISPIGDMDIEMVTWIDGCSDTDFVSIIEQFSPTITMVGDTSICEGQSVQLDVLGAVGSAVTWTPIGGLSNANVQNPVATPAASTVYTATVVSNSGCISIDSVEVLIDPYPQANFSVANVCLEQLSTFSDLTTISTGSIQSYNWTFGDGSTDNVSDPTHIYGTENAYNVQLTVISNQGCADSITQIATVSPLPIIDVSVVDDCALEELQFTNSSSITSGSIDVSDWLFGDGAQSNAFSPSHAYGNAGAFTVQLHLESNQQCSADTSFQVTVFPNPVASFSFSNVCDGMAMPFSDLSSVSAPGQLLLPDWYMGDGIGFQDSTLSLYTYATYGDQLVTLAVETTDGCTDTLTQTVSVHPIPQADFSFTNICEDDTVTFNDQSQIGAGDIANWDWTFGNSLSYSGSQPDGQVYPSDSIYPVSLTVTSDSGCVDVLLDTIEVYPVPLANFMFDSVCFPDPLQFTDLSDPNGAYPITQYAWTFSDGQTSNLSTPTIVFDSFGAYNATLLVANSWSCKNSITLGDALVHPLPVAEYVANFGHCIGEITEFDDVSTLDVLSNDVINEWMYTLDDGQLINTPAGEHLYTDPGLYQVELRVMTNHGCADSITHTVEVYPRPVAAWEADPTEGCIPLKVHFNDNSTIPAPYSINHWKWDLGVDSAGMAAVPNPTFTYEPQNVAPLDSVTYNISLIVTSANGCSDSLSVDSLIVLHPVPEAFFKTNPNKITSVTEPFFDFTDLSSENVNQWNWEFGDGMRSMEQHPTHEYGDTGHYPIVLFVETEHGCTDEANYEVIVEPTFTFYIPSAFTPNSDDVNEAFIGQGTGFIDYNMTIHDRWGELLFESNNPEQRWDGRYKGAIVPQGQYIYRFRLIDWSGLVHDYIGKVAVMK